MKEKLLLLFLPGVVIAMFLSTSSRPVHAQSSTPWFSTTIGETTCRVSKISQSPIRVSYLCFNPYGAQAGSYTADATNGTVAPNVFLLGMNSLPPVINPSAVNCLIGMNGTNSPVTAGSLGTIPPQSATYSCSGLTGSTISWP